jgi:hypothetical protein
MGEGKFARLFQICKFDLKLLKFIYAIIYLYDCTVKNIVKYKMKKMINSKLFHFYLHLHGTKIQFMYSQK